MVEVDCRKIKNYEDFINAFNRVLIEPAGGKWNGNLDAFNDYLSWPEQTPYQLIIFGSEQCSKVLNYKANEQHNKKLWPLLKEILSENKEWIEVEFK